MFSRGQWAAGGGSDLRRVRRRAGSAPGATTRWICAGCDDAVDLRRE
ncbi:hypothetical protein C731_3228 [Mycolicibacterium hassiacum DSM 44199]|uniref:Uncharacterized protein n=1 Tax=Mycolicibacterium hassiacum (strain DSM 44199 / CIP 105218 / JCM 12690 / 3849) TaxID=1122247 RepID=K5B7Z1_MYCHD|nr:hypothetical protein C731_3228 [Mycolicibacterium hassiacum DSM 44199]